MENSQIKKAYKTCPFPKNHFLFLNKLTGFQPRDNSVSDLSLLTVVGSVQFLDSKNVAFCLLKPAISGSDKTCKLAYHLPSERLCLSPLLKG